MALLYNTGILTCYLVRAPGFFLAIAPSFFLAFVPGFFLAFAPGFSMAFVTGLVLHAPLIRFWFSFGFRAISFALEKRVVYIVFPEFFLAFAPL
jgi:hypothetical protein